MEFERKLEILGEGARFDLSCACGDGLHRVKDPFDRWIYPAVLPSGRVLPILKILMTNYCDNDCFYCENRKSRDFKRITFQPEELARGFMNLFNSGRVKGLFLSSANWVCATSAMDRILSTAEILRKKYKYRGYLHLKILPGSEPAQIERAGEIATRVSINLEVPERRYLEVVAPDKKPEDLTRPLKLIKKFIVESKGKNFRWAPAGFTTQFIVGSAGENDMEILKTTSFLYGNMGARRIYFSAFQPVPGTPLENNSPCPLIREHRLYQCDFLLRKYGFKYEDFIFDKNGNLFLEDDPKTLWAKTNHEIFPVEINDAPLKLLLRVPGIGPVSARRIILARKEGRISNPDALKKIGVNIKKASAYILLSGRRVPRQMVLNESSINPIF